MTFRLTVGSGTPNVEPQNELNQSAGVWLRVAGNKQSLLRETAQELLRVRIDPIPWNLKLKGNTVGNLIKRMV
ncbi:MAG TPA: hypothetical protein VHQ22_10390 [Terriglobales bacterium]|jgi:hypothetical protein|nr:hypothetical protein [Terriglobales bacterium]